MARPIRVICVGRGATVARVSVDLQVSPADRRVMYIQRNDDTIRLYGLRDSGFVWVNMGASFRQLQEIKIQSLREVSINEAREMLHAES